MIWKPESTTPRFLLRFSNALLNGPNKLVWFIETLFLVGTSFLIAYLVPQVFNRPYRLVPCLCKMKSGIMTREVTQCTGHRKTKSSRLARMFGLHTISNSVLLRNTWETRVCRASPCSLRSKEEIISSPNTFFNLMYINLLACTSQVNSVKYVHQGNGCRFSVSF